MLKRNFRMIIMFLLINSIILSGCTYIPSLNFQGTTQIPFITYHTAKNGTIDAKLAYWDIDNGKINFTNEIAYNTVLDEFKDNMKPIAWNGDNRFVLEKGASPQGRFKSESEVVSNKDGCEYIYIGNNIKAKLHSDEIHPIKNFTLYLYEGKKVIQRTVELFYKTKDLDEKDIIVGDDFSDILSSLDYSNGEARFVYTVFCKGQATMYLATYNVAKNKVTWKKINIPEDAEIWGNIMPSPQNTALMNSKLYIQDIDTFSEVDLKEKKFKKLHDVVKQCHSIVKGASYEFEIPQDIRASGYYNDILILHVPIMFSDKVEYMFCAFKDYKFLGAIRLLDNDQSTWEIIDRNKKVTSRFSGKTKNFYDRYFNIRFPRHTGSK